MKKTLLAILIIVVIIAGFVAFKLVWFTQTCGHEGQAGPNGSLPPRFGQSAGCCFGLTAQSLNIPGAGTICVKK